MLKNLAMTNIDLVNRFLLNNAKWATVTEILLSNSSKQTDIALDLTANSNLSSYQSSGKVRFTCDDVDTGDKRFVVSEDCELTWRASCRTWAIYWQEGDRRDWNTVDQRCKTGAAWQGWVTIVRNIGSCKYWS